MPGADETGTDRATIRSIADATGYSIATVSRALKESPSVRRQTMEKVLSVAGKLGYRRNPAGAGLRTGRTEMICLAMPVARAGDLVGDIGALQLIRGATERLAADGYSLNLVPYDADEHPVEALGRAVRLGNFDGVCMSLTRPQDERVEYLTRHNIPFVTFGRTELPVEHAYYDVDNDDFAYRAAQYLISRGCRRPVLVTPPPLYCFARHRRTGFMRALRDAGLAFDERTSLVSEENNMAFAAFATRAAVGEARPDGYVCSGEVSALAVARAVEKAGQVVGRDVHLVTMETSDLPSLYKTPVAGFFQNLHRAGSVLADLLVRRIAGEPPEKLQLVEHMVFRDRR